MDLADDVDKDSHGDIWVASFFQDLTCHRDKLKRDTQHEVFAFWVDLGHDHGGLWQGSSFPHV